MSILSGFDKQKRYITDDNGDKKLVSEWTSTDTVELSDGVVNDETTLEDATDWLTAYDDIDTQPALLTELVSKLTTYMSNVKYLKNELDALKAVDPHPVGSLYWSADSTDPGELFGGTWEQIKDKFIIAAGDTYAAGNHGGAATREVEIVPAGTIGDKSITLQVSNMPNHSHSMSHNHTINAFTATGTATGGAHSHSYSYPKWYGTGTGDAASANGSGWEGYYGTYTTTGSGEHSHSVSVSIPAKTTNSQSTTTTGTAGGTSGVTQPFTHNHTFTGIASSTTINILPPYIAYYCWQRTA